MLSPVMAEPVSGIGGAGVFMKKSAKLSK